jgi:hypothetical protein
VVNVAIVQDDLGSSICGYPDTFAPINAIIKAINIPAKLCSIVGSAA